MGRTDGRIGRGEESWLPDGQSASKRPLHRFQTSADCPMGLLAVRSMLLTEHSVINMPYPAVDPGTRRAELARIWANLTPWQRAAMSHLFRLYGVNKLCPSPEGIAESRRWERVLRIAMLTGREYPVPSVH